MHSLMQLYNATFAHYRRYFLLQLLANFRNITRITVFRADNTVQISVKRE